MTAETLLLLLVLFQLKHFLADFAMQSGWIVRTKGIYGHLGGIIHAGKHAAFSLIVMLVSPAEGMTLVWIALAEFVVHYHIDWAKDKMLRKLGATPDQWSFWVLTGIDQFAHQMTYVAMLAALLWMV